MNPAVLSISAIVACDEVGHDPNAVGHDSGRLPFSIKYYILFGFMVCRRSESEGAARDTGVY